MLQCKNLLLDITLLKFLQPGENYEFTNSSYLSILLADWVAKGLNDGTFERVGGVIRDVTSKKIVTWLRDTNSVAPSVISFAANPVTGVLNLIASGANLAVSAKGFSSVNQRLDGIENQIASIGQSLQFTQGILQVSTAASILNLGVSVMGFAVISQRLNEIENQLKQSQELLNKINRKIDLSFYANFRAGIELAINAFLFCQSQHLRKLIFILDVDLIVVDANRLLPKNAEQLE